MKIDLPHILIVDDDKRILELISDYLIKNNFRVSTANNSLKASVLRTCSVIQENLKFIIILNHLSCSTDLVLFH